MTERIKGLVVTLEKDVHEDTARSMAEAIGWMRGVATVRAMPVDLGDHMNRMRVRSEMQRAILELFARMDRDEKSLGDIPLL